MRQLKGLIRMVKGGGAGRLCLTAVQNRGKARSRRMASREGRRGEVMENEKKRVAVEGAKGSAKLNRGTFQCRRSRPSCKRTLVLVCRRIIMMKRVRKHPNILRRRRGHESIVRTHISSRALRVYARTRASRCGISLSMKLLAE